MSTSTARSESDGVERGVASSSSSSRSRSSSRSSRSSNRTRDLNLRNAPSPWESFPYLRIRSRMGKGKDGVLLRIRPEDEPRNTEATGSTYLFRYADPPTSRTSTATLYSSNVEIVSPSVVAAIVAASEDSGVRPNMAAASVWDPVGEAWIDRFPLEPLDPVAMIYPTVPAAVAVTHRCLTYLGLVLRSLLVRPSIKQAQLDAFVTSTEPAEPADPAPPSPSPSPSSSSSSPPISSRASRTRSSRKRQRNQLRALRKAKRRAKLRQEARAQLPTPAAAHRASSSRSSSSSPSLGAACNRVDAPITSFFLRQQ